MDAQKLLTILDKLVVDIGPILLDDTLPRDQITKRLAPFVAKLTTELGDDFELASTVWNTTVAGILKPLGALKPQTEQ